MSDTQRKMAATVKAFEQSIIGIRIGQVSPSLIDTFVVNAYGQNMPIKHIASSAVEGGGIRVYPHDPTLTTAICQSLQSAGFNAYQYSSGVVAVSIPPASGEERDRVKARVKTLAEEAKVAIRNIRKAARNSLDPSLSQSEKKGRENQIQTLTDSAIKEISEMAAHKINSF